MPPLLLVIVSEIPARQFSPSLFGSLPLPVSHAYSLACLILGIVLWTMLILKKPVQLTR